jgi:hypothetical protein
MGLVYRNGSPYLYQSVRRGGGGESIVRLHPERSADWPGARCSKCSDAGG